MYFSTHSSITKKHLCFVQQPKETCENLAVQLLSGVAMYPPEYCKNELKQCVAIAVFNEVEILVIGRKFSQKLFFVRPYVAIPFIETKLEEWQLGFIVGFACTHTKGSLTQKPEEGKTDQVQVCTSQYGSVGCHMHQSRPASTVAGTY